VSDQPPYLAIAEALRDEIANGLEPGTRLPSNSVLGKRYGVAQSVAGRAYGVLVEEGLVVSRHGAGHYVRGPQAAEVLVRRHRMRSKDSPFAEGAAEQGMVGSWQHDSATARASGEVAERLAIAEGDPVMRTEYVYLANEVPVQLATSWEPLSVTGGSVIVLPEAGPTAGIGVAARMRLIDIEVGTPVERIRARRVTQAEAVKLQCPPAEPVLFIERTYYDQATGRAVETADITALGSRWVAEYGQRPQA
jgi:GntR family transcriptional regulator